MIPMAFAGIAPANVPAFIAARLPGAALAAGTASRLFRDAGEADWIGARKNGSANRTNAD